MKNDRKIVEERQNRILSFVREKTEAGVDELAELCGVSPMTIRRDLNELSEKGLVKRLHGRAVSVASAASYYVTDPVIEHCRDMISAFAAGLITDGDVIFINGSGTALNMLDYVDNKRITVRTNNGHALEHAYPEGVRIFLIGGEVYQKIMVGEYVIQNLLNLAADRTFLGCAAVYDDGEFRYDIPTEIGINEIMISRTRGELYILADHSKLKKRVGAANAYGSFRYNYPVTLITDDMADEEILKKLKDHDIKIIQVKTS